jgi:hypothetical protein
MIPITNGKMFQAATGPKSFEERPEIIVGSLIINFDTSMEM